MSESSKLMLWLQGAMWLIGLRLLVSVTWATTGNSTGSRHKSKWSCLRLSFHNSEIEKAERGKNLELYRN